MLGVKLICVGKLKEAYWRDAVAEYEKRLRPLCKWELIELPEARLPSEPSQGEIDAVLEKEGEQILRHAVGKIYPLCIEGKLLDSPGLAKRLACLLYTSFKEPAVNRGSQKSRLLFSSLKMPDKQCENWTAGKMPAAE